MTDSFKNKEKSRPESYLHVVSRVYLVLLAILLILNLIFSTNVSLIGIIRSALVGMLFPSLILLPANLLLRQWRAAAILALPVLAWIFLYAPFFVPRTQPAAEQGIVLEVLTLNVHKPHDNSATHELATLIRTSGAHIVALQELGSAPHENFGALLREEYPYQALYLDEHYPGSGQGILSQYPILAEEYWKAGGPWNGNLRVELDVEGQRVFVYNLHPHPPIERGLNPQMASHAQVFREVLDRANEDTGAVLLVGDFNMTGQFAPYQWIAADYTDSYRAVGDVGFGFTHPHYEPFPLPPLWRIDYVFYDEYFRGLEAHMLPGSASTDHLPLLVRMQLIEP